MKKYNFLLMIFLWVNNFSFILSMDAPLKPLDQVFLNACRDGKPIKLVLDMGADMYAVDPKNGCNGLHYACQGGHIEVVRCLLQKENSYHHCLHLVVSRDLQGKQPYHYALESDYTAIVKLIADYRLENLIRVDDLSYEEFVTCAEDFIKHGADVNADYDCRLFTPLMTICAYYVKGDIERIRFLLGAGAKINLAVNGLVPIVIALANSGNISDEERLELMKLFIDKGADINARGKNGCSLMHQAILLDDIGLVNFLIEKNIILGQQDCFGQNEIHHAVMNQNENILQLLLDREIPMISAIGEDGVWPLHAAVIRSNKNIIKIILRKMKELDVDINTLLDHEGQSPLHYAAEQGSLEVVQMLLDAGAQQFLDKNSRTPFVLSCENENKEIWLLLGANLIPLMNDVRSRLQQNMDNVPAQQEKKCIKNSEKEKETKKTKKKNKKKKKKKEIQQNEFSTKSLPERAAKEIPQIVEEKKPLDISCEIQPTVLELVPELADMCIVPKDHKYEQENASKTKAEKKLSFSLQKNLNYASALIGKGLNLAAQTMDFRDDIGRLTRLHMQAGFYTGSASSLSNYKKTQHVEEKADKKSDLFHAISDEQVKMVLKHGEMFGTRKNGRVKCYRMPTTKDALSIRYESGSLEVSVDTQTNEIVHAFYNKKKENKSIYPQV